MTTLPSLHTIHVIDTDELFEFYAKSIDHAKQMTHAIKGYENAEVTVEQVLLGDGWPVYQLQDIPYSSFFRTVNRTHTKVGKITYVKDCYDPCSKKYMGIKFSDISESKLFHGIMPVVIDFTF